MRIILKEEQFNRLKEISVINSLVTESFSISDLLKKYKGALLAGIAASTILFSIDHLGIDVGKKDYLKNQLGLELTTDKNETLKQQKIKAVEEFFENTLAKRNIPIEKLQLSAEKIVNACDEYGVDIAFLLATATQESFLGTTNRARRTNSVWSVGCYDNGKNVCTYTSQNQSIVPYLKLLKNRYLVGKSVDDLLKSGNFTDVDGHRYASDKNYENNIKSIRNRIIKEYPILA